MPHASAGPEHSNDPDARPATLGAGARRHVPRLATLLVLSAAALLGPASAALAQVSFGAATSFPVGDDPGSVAVGDFDGDSDPDVAVANQSSDNVSVLLGGPGGGFGTATSYATADGPVSVAVGDFDGDSDPDLAIANESSDNVSVLLGGPGGSFGAATNFPAGDLPESVAVGDFDGDSDSDLAVANHSSNDVSVLLGGPGGSFGTATNYAVADGPGSVAVGDFNGDSDPDLAVTRFWADDVAVLLGGAGGSFGAATNFAVGDFPWSMAVGDFDGDSDPDLAVVNFSSNDVSVLLGGPGGSFGTATNYAVADEFGSVAVGDFNGDSDPDLAVTRFSADDVAVLLGGPGGSFGAATNFAAGGAPGSLAVGDFDGDSDPDLALANVISNYVSVLLNNRLPSAADDAYATDEDTALVVAAPGVLGNDSGDALSAVPVSGPAHGDLELNPDGSFSYTPDADYNGRDTFSYRASNGEFSSEPVAVTIEVKAVDDPAPPAGQASTPPAGPDSTPPAEPGSTPPADAAPAGPAQPVIGQMRLASRCVRRSRSGRVRIRMSLRLARRGPLQIRIDRAVGSGASRRCPGPNAERRFSGRFRNVATLSLPATRPAGAAAIVARRLTLNPRLAPGLYRISVRAQLDHNRFSRPVRRYLWVLGPPTAHVTGPTYSGYDPRKDS
jgi:predicted NUDIX family NTP pyrophosphohydrolase